MKETSKSLLIVESLEHLKVISVKIFYGKLKIVVYNVVK
jgi:hypothetical protein